MGKCSSLSQWPKALRNPSNLVMFILRNPMSAAIVVQVNILPASHDKSDAVIP